MERWEFSSISGVFDTRVLIQRILDLSAALDAKNPIEISTGANRAEIDLGNASGGLASFTAASELFEVDAIDAIPDQAVDWVSFFHKVGKFGRETDHIIISPSGTKIEDFAGFTTADEIVGTFLSGPTTLVSTKADGNYLNGYSGNDSLWSDIGADILIGGAGKDYLSLGGGEDTIVFDVAVKKKNADVIEDFDHDSGAIMALDADVFFGLEAGALANSQFKDLGTRRVDKNDRILMDESGKIFFDQDGSATKFKPILVFTQDDMRVDHTDFLVI